jgi:hypothetical protein
MLEFHTVIFDICKLYLEVQVVSSALPTPKVNIDLQHAVYIA